MTNISVLRAGSGAVPPTLSGELRSASTDGNKVDADVIGVIYAIVGVGIIGGVGTIPIDAASLLVQTNDDIEWFLLKNPTVAGVFAYSPVTLTVEAARGATANTVTGGERLPGGFGAGGGGLSGSSGYVQFIDGGIQMTGTDKIVLCVRPLSSNADIQGTLVWRE